MKERLVLLPGWGMHSGVWGDFAELLSQYFTLTLIDHLPSLDNIEAVGDEIIELLDDEPFYLLGWSLGGSVALNMAQRYPSRVKGVILLATNPCFVANEAWPGMPLAMFRAFTQQVHLNASATLQGFLMLQCQGVTNSHEYLETLKARFASKEMLPLNALVQNLALLEKVDLRDVLTALACPVVAILSDNDALVPVTIGQVMQTLQPNLQLHIIEKAGHIPFMVQTEVCVNIICAFIDGIRKN
jgi:pimeloyl-[acyl-carrier protein] methyl ester esterase